MAWHALVVVQLHVVVERREFLIAAQQVDEGLLVGDMGGDARRLEHFQRIARQAVGLAHAAGDVARIGFDRVGRESCERKIRFQQAPCHPFVFAVSVLVIPDDLQVVVQFGCDELHGLPYLPLFCSFGDPGGQPQGQQYAARDDRELARVVADFPLFDPFFEGFLHGCGVVFLPGMLRIRSISGCLPRPRGRSAGWGSLF